MALTGSDKAYLYARSGIARSGATRSNYVAPATLVEWIRRDADGDIIATADLTEVILAGSLHVTQALNDEPDTCSFELRPQEPPAMTPACGDEIRVSWAPGAPVFYGFIVIVQQDWRLGNLQPPWLAVQCQDAMFRFDARFVTYRFPAQSVTQSIAFLVATFCNLSPTTPHPLDFVTTSVQAAMPSIAAFDVVNQRPSTVMRTLTAAVGGAFYVDGVTVHAWAGSATEPDQPNPQPLTVGLATLKSFRLTTDATQLRRRVLVEGRRTQTLIGFPDAPLATTGALGLPLEDATLFDFTVPSTDHQLVRIGTQWAIIAIPTSVTALGVNPPQTQVAVAYAPADVGDDLWVKQVTATPPPVGWIRIGNQYARYQSVLDNPLTGNWRLVLAPLTYPFGALTIPIPVNETVEWVDNVLTFAGVPLDWTHTGGAGPGVDVRNHPPQTPVVTMAVAQTALGTWPPLESLVQDGRYSYAGAQTRAAADLEAFSDPLVSAEWETEDVNARPGRSQAIAMTSDTVDPAVSLTVTILHVDLTFPLRTLPPRRACTGGVLKPSTFLDLVVTSSD